MNLRIKMMVLTDEQKMEFEEKIRPLMEWLGNNLHPHVKVIVNYSDVEILEGSMVFKTEDYIAD